MINKDYRVVIEQREREKRLKEYNTEAMLGGICLVALIALIGILLIMVV